MKQDVKRMLKERGYPNLFSEARYMMIKELMAEACSLDKQLKGYLSISPDFKVDFIVDHMIKHF